MAMAAMSIDLLLPAFPEMREAFGLAPGATEISRVLTGFFVGLGVGSLVFGPLSDRFGRKPILHAGIAVYIVGALGSTRVGSLNAFVLCRFVWGLGAACPRSLALSILRDVFEGDHMARAMSNVMPTFLIVPIVAPSFGSVLLLVDWHLTIWVAVAVAVVLTAWVATRLPETLPVEERLSLAPSALWSAAGAVVRNRQTMAFTASSTFLIGIITAYVDSTQLIIDEVFGQADLFPVLFGVIAVGLALGSLLSARLVTHVGLDRLVCCGAVAAMVAAAVLALIGVTTGGHPPLWMYLATTAVMLPAVASLGPNTNTAATTPLGDVAGMAAAIITTISTAGGALLGSIIDSAYDGSVRPFTIGALAFAAAACAAVWLAGPPQAHVPDELIAKGEGIAVID